MLPQVFLERMQGLLGSEYEEFLVSFDHEKYQALRLNPLKLRTESGRTDDSTVIEEKIQQTFRLHPVPWADNGYYYTKEDQPGKHPWHEAGLYYIQEPSAMAPVTLLSPQPGERILDLCAAPGGKVPRSHQRWREKDCLSRMRSTRRGRKYSRRTWSAWASATPVY